VWYSDIINIYSSPVQTVTYELTEYADSAQLSPKYVTNLTHTKYVHKTVLPNGKISNISINVKPTFVEILVDHNVFSSNVY